MTDRVLLVQALMCLEEWEGTLDEDCGDPVCDECKPFRKTREVIAALRERLSRCDQCGKANSAEIHTCSPKQGSE